MHIYIYIYICIYIYTYVTDVTLALDCRAPAVGAQGGATRLQHVCVVVAGGPWELRECSVRCAGGGALAVVGRGQVRGVCASIGGVGEGWGESAERACVASDRCVRVSDIYIDIDIDR